MTGGTFIVIDGVDGAGKGTQVALLREALVARGRAVHVTCEPSDLPIGAMIRKYLRRELEEPGWEAMALLFAADRMQHCRDEILPRVAAGEIVLCDRYDASSLAYQSAMRGLATSDDAEQERALHWIATINDHAARPALTIMLDLHPDLAAERRALRGGAEELLERIDLQRRVRAQYAKIPALRSRDRFEWIDASHAPADVHARILEVVLPLV